MKVGIFIKLTGKDLPQMTDYEQAYEQPKGVDDSTLLAVVRKPARVLARINRVLAGIQEECTHWSTILNPIKTKALVVSRSRTVNPPHGDLVLSGVYIRASPNLDILGMKFDSKLTFEDHEHGIVSPVSQRIGILKLVNCIFVDTSVVYKNWNP